MMFRSDVISENFPLWNIVYHFQLLDCEIIATRNNETGVDPIIQPQSHPIPKFYTLKWDGTEAG